MLTATKAYTVNGEDKSVVLMNRTETPSETQRFQFNKLTPYTMYTAQVQALTIAYGDVSDLVSHRTLPDSPVRPLPPLAISPTQLQSNPDLATTSSSYAIYLNRGSTLNGLIR